MLGINLTVSFLIGSFCECNGRIHYCALFDLTFLYEGSCFELGAEPCLS